MKATDLMIGDWVRNKEGKNEQVTSLYDGYICTETHEDSHDYHFEPVPLTPEILEKNGFVKNGSSYDLREGRHHIYIIFHNGKWAIDIHNELALKDSIGRADLICFGRDWAEKYYVHELQHVLRLCGIDKEITL